MDATNLLREAALELGFDAVGVTTVEPFTTEEAAIHDRIDRGYFDGIDWFTRDRTARSCYPERHLAGAQAIVSVAMSYLLPEAPASAEGDGPTGRIARYALGRDYHQVIGEKLQRLKQTVQSELGGAGRPCVDSSPMVDRAAAVRSGVGFYGKNTNVIHPKLGSFIFLGELIVDRELSPDPPSRRSCGTCTRCIPACPTGAIADSWVVDSSRCISYLTIEHRGFIPVELRPLLGDWIFGCDICQDVCPINARARPIDQPELRPLPGVAARLPLIPLLALTEDEFRQRFRNSPILRAKRRGLLRNACVALGNAGDPAAIPALMAALEDPEPLVRGHAAWALGQLRGAAAVRRLEHLASQDPSVTVQEEAHLALDACL